MKNKKTFLLLLLVPIIIFFIGRTFALPYTEEIRSVEIQSENYPNPGSWHIDKSAKWIDVNKARVTFDVNSILETTEGRYKDVILVIDISGSMKGNKLTRAEADAIDLTNYLLSDNHNSVALITFDTSSTIVSGFINDRDTMLNYLNVLTAYGSTNYNSALQNVDIVMQNYVRKDNTDVVTLFLTDGYPNEDTPNQIATYHLLKDKYPYMTINGIQYEMGKDIIQEIIDITDNQWVADMDTLHNVLFDAIITPLIYDNFVITDYINDDYFHLNSINDIDVNMGEVTLEDNNNKIVWNLGNNYKTGNSIKMTIDLQLKEEYHETSGYYPTNKSESIVYKSSNGNEETVNSPLTPVLKNFYYVMYENNTPNGCTLPDYEPEEHYMYQNVTKKQDNLSCTGYIFKGWEIDDTDKNDMKIINDDMFVMPEHDVHLIGTWSKQDIVKKMDGTISEKMTLYQVVQNDANEGTYAQKYTGAHQDSYDNSGISDIYYYYASDATNAQTIIKEKNNVIFANHCWQMYRTTDTGGVKLIYNGEPENDMCMNSIGSQTGRGSHVGFNSRSTSYLSDTNYYYGTDYTYDKETKKFKLSGSIMSQEVTSDNISSVVPTLKGKYTCKSEDINATCSYLYIIDDYSDGNYAYTYSLSSYSSYAQLGTVQYNQVNNSYTSLADVGYMYNKRYEINSRYTESTESMLGYTLLDTSYWYSPSINWGTPVANRYNLVNPTQIGSTSNYYNLKGKYTFLSSSQNYAAYSAYYISGANTMAIYYITLTNGHDLAYYNYAYTYGDSYIKNADGTYTITNTDGTNPEVVYRSDWYRDYATLRDKYVCKNAINNTCSEAWYVTGAVLNEFYYVKAGDSYKFAKDFEYKLDPNDGTYKYFLTDDNNGSVTFWNIYGNRNNLYTYHYTCWNESGVCTQVSYVYSISLKSVYFINIEDGKNVDDALEEMLSLDNDNYHVNTKDSFIKTLVDIWYKKYIYNEFDKYIEDTIYCNDRSITEKGGYDPDGGDIYEVFQFKEYNVSSDLSCTNETDRFSTLNNKAKLTYKVGLMTSPEVNILGHSAIRTTDWTSYFLMSPYNSYNSYPTIRYVSGSGNIDHTNVNNMYGIRPVVSLKPGIKVDDGDGSMEHPYRVEDGTDH